MRSMLGAMRILRWLIASLLIAFAPRVHADEADAHYRQGLSHKQQGKLDDAIDEFKKAIELRKDYAAAEFSLGLTYKLKGNFEEAASHLERAAKLQPKTADIHTSLGVTYH